MNENLIQALTSYTSTLEQQLAALEARVKQLEEQLVNVKSLNEVANEQIAALQAEITTLASTQTVVSTDQEPDVEIEFILDEETQDTEVKEETTEESSEESTDNAIPVTEVLIVAEEPQEMVLETAFSEEPEGDDDITTAPSKEIEDVPKVSVVNEAPEEVAEEASEVAPTETTEEVEELEVAEEKTEEKEVAPSTQSTLTGPAVQDIRQAIALGDRFLFQRELFAGNGEQMQRTLDELNGLQTLQEAMDYINQNFAWDLESSAAELFINVLKRRFN
ncbi:MAG: hypothetical protein IKY49_01750 [Paludibacteraceae bacterium]|nr:hypothetical protein [Paludibacteraceae bacterium]